MCRSSFQGQHIPGRLGAVSSDEDEDDFSPYGETSRDDVKDGWASLLHTSLAAVVWSFGPNSLWHVWFRTCVFASSTHDNSVAVFVGPGTNIFSTLTITRNLNPSPRKLRHLEVRGNREKLVQYRDTSQILTRDLLAVGTKSSFLSLLAKLRS